jgi:hypothetical protein
MRANFKAVEPEISYVSKNDDEKIRITQSPVWVIETSRREWVFQPVGKSRYCLWVNIS